MQRMQSWKCGNVKQLQFYFGSVVIHQVSHRSPILLSTLAILPRKFTVQ